MMKNNDKKNISLSIVIPVYNDESVLQELYSRLMPAIEPLTDNIEVLFIDDGSKDRSFEILKELKKLDRRLVVLKLTRNFGQSNAITAGLDHASGDFVVIMDSDLQDPPEFIPALLTACIENDVEMAIARRIQRNDSWIKKRLSGAFHNISQLITSMKIPANLGVFRVVRRSAYEKIKDVPEVTGTSLSLLYWGGFDLVAVDMNRDARFAGESGYTLRKMLQLAFYRIFSYSLWPVRFATIIGTTVSMISFILGFYFLLRKLFMQISVAGWTSLIVLILFLFGINFIIMGIVGEYLGRIYLETKRRPKYIVGKVVK